MGQIVFNGQRPKYCNIQAIQEGGQHVNDAVSLNEIWLVDTSNSLKSDKGTGRYDAYIVGDGIKTAGQLAATDLKYIDTTGSGDAVNNPDNEDLVSVIEQGNNVLKFKNKTYNAVEYSGYGKKYLRKNIKTEEVKEHIIRTLIPVDSSVGYRIDNVNYKLDYEDSAYIDNFRTSGTHFAVEAGDVIEFQASSATQAAIGSDYPKWRMWVLVDPVTKNIIQDDNGKYIMAEPQVNYEGVSHTLVLPKSGELCVNCWTGQTSSGKHNVYRVTYDTTEEEMNIFDGTLCTDVNTIYIVQYDYDLNGREITLPHNSILQFQGGSIKNSSGYGARIIGNNSYISSPPLPIFCGNVSIGGSWLNDEYYPEWFGAIGDGITDDTAALKAVLNSVPSITSPLQKTVKLIGSYVFSNTLNLYANTTLKGCAIGAHEQNNAGKDTLIADFPSNLMVAIQSANISGLTYKDGVARTAVDGGTVKYCNSVRIEDIRLRGKFVSTEIEGVTTNRPIFCGIKIAASLNSSIKNVRVRGFWYGIARFSTWYASDEDIFVNAHKVGYYASYDMNNFSIRNGYINANRTNLDITPNSNERFATDPQKTRTIGVLALYAKGALYNIISETAYYARYYGSHSYITDIQPWLEQNAWAYSIHTGARVVIINGTFSSNSYFMDTYDSTAVTLIGTTPSGMMSIGAHDVVNYDYVTRSDTQPILGLPSGVGRYYVGNHTKAWWDSDDLMFKDSNGYGIPNIRKGSYANRPTVPSMQPGMVYMKTEDNGIVRPVFLSYAGSRAYVYFTVALWSTSGTITININNNVSYSYNYTAGKFTTISGLLFDMAKSAFSQGYAAFAYTERNLLRLYNSKAETLAKSQVTFNDGGVGISSFSVNGGANPTYVDAFGGTAANNKQVSELPATAVNGDILFYTVIGKPIYYNNGSWYDFSNNIVVPPAEEPEENSEPTTT